MHLIELFLTDRANVPHYLMGCMCVRARDVSAVEQLGRPERRGDVTRRPQDLVPDVQVPVEPDRVVHRSGHGQRALHQRLGVVAEHHR